MGLLDTLNTPEGMGLLAAVAGGAAGARRGTPWNNFGRAGLAGLSGYASAQDQVRADQENAFQQQYRQMQMDEITRQRQAADKKREIFTNLAPQFTQPTYGEYQADNPFAENLGNLAAKTGERFDLQGFQKALPGEMAKAGFVDDALAMLPTTEKPQLVTVYDEQGRPTQKWLRPGESDGVTVGMGKPDTASQSSVGQMIAEMNRLPPGDPMRTVYQQAITKATTHAPAAQMNNYGSPVAGVDANGNPVFFQPSKGGGAPAIVPGVAPSPKPATPPTEAEAKAAFYASNMRAASAQYDELEKQGFDPTQPASQVETALAGGMTNPLASKLAQQARQSQNQWAEQMLRMQTGAAATEDETKRTVRTYFPQFGDSPDVVAQKKAMRKQAEQGVYAASGRASGRVNSQTSERKVKKYNPATGRIE